MVNVDREPNRKPRRIAYSMNPDEIRIDLSLRQGEKINSVHD